MPAGDDANPAAAAPTLADVVAFAAKRHGTQTDKAGQPYVGHVMRVWANAWRAGGDEIAQMAALLHDIVEDDKATEQELRDLGVPGHVIDLVKVLTRDPDGDSDAYYEAIAAHPDARASLVKFADIDDNTDRDRLALLSEADRNYLTKKYEHARQLLAPPRPQLHVLPDDPLAAVNALRASAGLPPLEESADDDERT